VDSTISLQILAIDIHFHGGLDVILGVRLKYSIKKALERSKLSKERAKGRVLELGSVKKALTYPSTLLSEIGVVE
jgi:hypothetical protein